MKLLLIDDDPDIRFLVEFVLSQGGHSVVSCESGTEGIAAAEPTAPDVILLDMLLDDMHGTEVLRGLRAEGVSAPVVFLTGKSDMTAEDARAAGAIGVLHKPFDPSRLDGDLSSVLADAGI